MTRIPEKERNDKVRSGQTIYPGNEYIGDYNDYCDFDNFHLSFPEDGYYHCMVYEEDPSQPLGHEIKVSKRRSKKTLTTVARSSGYGAQSILVYLKKRETYYVRLNNFRREFDGKYILKVDRAMPITATSNTSSSKAIVIQEDQNLLMGVKDKYDENWYKVKFNNSGKANFELQPIDEDLDVDLYIYDENLRPVNSSNHSKGDKEVVKDVYVDRNKYYYIKVDHSGRLPYGYTGNKYWLRCKQHSVNSNGSGGGFSLSDIGSASYIANITNSVEASSQGVEGAINQMNSDYKICVADLGYEDVFKNRYRENFDRFHSKLSELEEKLKQLKSGITAEVEKYIANNRLTGKKAEALRLIPTYKDNTIIKKYGTHVYLFEGAGGYRKINSAKHPKGRFGALAVLVKDGKITHITDQASTLPDQPLATYKDGNLVGQGHATTKPGVYNGQSDVHRSKNPCIAFEGNGRVSAFRHTNPNTTATSIHLHHGFDNDNPTSPTSTGCCIIHKSQYLKFGQLAGFVKPGAVINYKDPTQGEKYLIKGKTYAVIIDRSLADRSLLAELYTSKNVQYIV